MRDNALLSFNNLRIWEKQATVVNTHQEVIQAKPSQKGTREFRNLISIFNYDGILVELPEVLWNPLGGDPLFAHYFETFVLECEGIEESS